MKADRIVLGMAVIVAGMIWLLINLGLLSPVSVRELWRYWPLLLVIWGLLLLLGKGNSGISGCLVAVLILFLIFGGVFSFGQYNESSLTINTDIENTYNAESIRLELKQNAGGFRLMSHQSDELLNLRLQTTEEPKISHTQKGDIAEITVEDRADKIIFGKQTSRWNLSLPEGMPTEITLRTGALDADLDMTNLLIQKLDLKAGAGDMTMRLPHTDGEINVQTGAANIIIYIPSDVGVRLNTNGALISVKSENGRMVSMGERNYESRDLETKNAIIDIQISAAAGSVTLRGN